jgi:hypothetical protein
MAVPYPMLGEKAKKIVTKAAGKSTVGLEFAALRR